MSASEETKLVLFDIRELLREQIRLLEEQNRILKEINKKS